MTKVSLGGGKQEDPVADGLGWIHMQTDGSGRTLGAVVSCLSGSPAFHLRWVQVELRLPVPQQCWCIGKLPDADAPPVVVSTLKGPCPSRPEDPWISGSRRDPTSFG